MVFFLNLFTAAAATTTTTTTIQREKWKVSKSKMAKYSCFNAPTFADVYSCPNMLHFPNVSPLLEMYICAPTCPTFTYVYLCPNVPHFYKYLFVPQCVPLLQMYICALMCPTSPMCPTFTNVYLCTTFENVYMNPNYPLHPISKELTGAKQATSLLLRESNQFCFTSTAKQTKNI